MRITTMLKKTDVAKDLGVSTATIDNLVATGWLHPTFLGKGLKFSQEDLLEFQRKARNLDIRSIDKMAIEKEKIASGN